jgi:DIM1 family U5 snRNP protein
MISELAAHMRRNWAMDNKQEVILVQKPRSNRVILYPQVIDIIETVYRGASKGRGLVVSPKGTF